MRMNSPEGKRILALVRGGAYAHAGETEAIELTLRDIPKRADREILDAGCGLGGTAEYIAIHGWGRVTGCDIDAKAIELAQRDFPNRTFVAADIAQAGEIWRDTFDLIYCFNSVYAFPDQPVALQALAGAARPGAQLLIFDYTDPERRFGVSDFREREDASFWQPLEPEEFSRLAGGNGWLLNSFSDLSADYVRWYDELAWRIENKRAEVTAGFGPAAYEFVRVFYGSLRDAIDRRVLGGGVFRFTAAR